MTLQNDWRSLCATLFPHGHTVQEDADLLWGEGQCGEHTLAVLGTCNHAEIGAQLALRQARAVLTLIREHPRRPLLLLVDTVGQRLRQREELLAINGYMAHLAKCVQLAREQGHVVLALVYQQALSGGFLSTGLMADQCFALPQALIRVMDLQAMARITKIPLEQLQQLASQNPVFAPGAENYWRMGGLQALWQDDLANALQQALQQALAQSGVQTAAADQRAALGAARGGRTLAQQVIDAVLQEDCDAAP